MEMFAELLSHIRSTFIEDGLVEDDAMNKTHLRRCESEPWMSTHFRWDIDTIEKGSDSDSTQDPQNELDSSDSCFEDVGWYRLSTAEYWPDDDSQWEPDMEQAMRVADEARSDPLTNVKSSSVVENRPDAEVSETENRSCLLRDNVEEPKPSNASSLEKAVSKERVRWADVEDDPGHEVRAPAANILVTVDVETRPLPKVFTSPDEASDAIFETKGKRTKRRKSLIDKAAIEQQHPRKSKLRPNAPAFVPMAVEATSENKRLCKQCGNGGQPNQKLCNYCGTPFPVMPLAFLGGAIIQ
jgi:hypothetical protein